MMIRDYLKWSTCVCLVFLPVLLGWRGLERIRSANVDLNHGHASRQTASVLQEDEWVQFQIPTGARNIRLMTNAAVSDDSPPDPTQADPRSGWRYSLDVELCDAWGKTVASHNYHFRSRVRQLIDAETGELIYPLFFGETMLPGTETRMMQMAVDCLEKEVAIVKVRLDRADPGVAEVVARVDTRVERDDYAQRTTWNRLSADGKNRVCRFNVYNHHLLTDSERVNLMRWQWVDSPTIGICASRYLYFVGEDEDRELNEKLVPAGLRVVPECMGVVPLPPENGTLRMEVTNLTHSRNPVELDLEWSPQSSGLSDSQQRTVEGEFLEFSNAWAAGGVLAVAASGEVVIRAYWKSELEDEIEITPETSGSSYFLVDQRPVEFEVSHYQERSTPFKIVGRVPRGELFADVDLNAHPALKWEALDSTGDIIQQGVLQGEYAVSRFDRLIIRSELISLTNSCAWYFDLPEAVTKIRFSSDSPMLITGAVRPPGFRRQVQVPEAYSTYELDEKMHRSWFLVRPVGHLDLIRMNRSFLVRTQQRPKKRDESIVAGDYEWEGYLPNRDWIGRQILVSKDDSFPIREQAAAVTFFGVMPGNEYQFEKISSQKTAARIFFARSESDLETDELIVTVDDEVVLRETIHSARGELRIQNVDIPKSGKIKIKTRKPMQLFVSGLSLNNQPRYLKRTAQRLDQGTLQFRFRKESAGEELLTIQFFRPLGETQRIKLHTTVIGVGQNSQSRIVPSTDWSLLDRTYNIAPGRGSAFLFGIADKLDGGQKCFLKFNSDVPPGDYLIEIKQSGEPNGFVLLYQTRAGSQSGPGSISAANNESSISFDRHNRVESPGRGYE